MKHLVLVHAEAVLDLVANATASATVGSLVLLTAEGVTDRLGGALVLLWLDRTIRWSASLSNEPIIISNCLPGNLVASVSHTLSKLVGGRLLALRSKLLLGLCDDNQRLHVTYNATATYCQRNPCVPCQTF